MFICKHVNCRNLRCDTHGVLALTDECLFVILSLWSDNDELECVRSGTKLSVGWFHFLTSTVSQVDATNRILTEDRKKTEGQHRLNINIRCPTVRNIQLSTVFSM